MRKQNLMLFPPEIASEFVAEQEGFSALATSALQGYGLLGSDTRATCLRTTW